MEGRHIYIPSLIACVMLTINGWTVYIPSLIACVMLTINGGTVYIPSLIASVMLTINGWTAYIPWLIACAMLTINGGTAYIPSLIAHVMLTINYLLFLFEVVSLNYKMKWFCLGKLRGVIEKHSLSKLPYSYYIGMIFRIFEIYIFHSSSWNMWY